ncbi:(2Fe-2S)-binding protein [Marinobacter lutaoensis]|jgi:hypothetical protein|uniref:Ferric siderophore reductase C-terminal domain-containing protein n=1 Tax=Marinobacter lutaoensis TaxID=135739 RepID=A0A1V2DQW2_9GAMM|nr:(2Fe-2S)-binding protein [Marinobacter lutaoensis]MBI42958.1 hypothetical protein [Oceanospirillales bacterium]NVD34574.1 (2Fe-2S)-binding protein [Marinobacter lutaoensis]ONF42889.1 hypothetical protein BTO32_14525 [Marinobacter lutaoensis]|tara:strand:- start:6635 stop:7444 length:810 start_codon:yes stop_codon:yes gene_type:complete
MAGTDGPERYHQLLRSTGLDARQVLSGALAPFEAPRPALRSLAQYLAQPEQLHQQLREEQPDATTPRLQRAYLSVLQQDLALQVIAPLTLRLFRDGQAPLPEPDRIFLAPPRPEAGTPPMQARWFLAPDQPTVTVATFVQETGKRLEEWYAVFRHRLGISPGAYWSSMGLGLGAPFSAVWNLAEPAPLCEQANAWLAGFGNEVGRHLDWIPLTFNGQSCAIPQRRGCCLKYLLPEGGYCGTCGIYRKDRLAALSRQTRSRAPGQWQPGQ